MDLRLHVLHVVKAVDWCGLYNCARRGEVMSITDDRCLCRVLHNVKVTRVITPTG